MNRNIETFIGCDCPYEQADIALFGAPFDSTTSFRPGTRFAARAMRSESWGLETYSPHQDLDMSDCCRVFDGGDLELPFGAPEQALAALEAHTAQLLEDGKRPFMIGGEHLVTLAPVRAVYKKHPDLCLLHFDAHTDLREDYLGVSLSHASVVRRIWEILGDGRVFQFGIRSGERSEFLWAKEHTRLQKFNFNGLDAVKELLGSRPVYLTVDLDVLDPSVFPGTGTPEPGGVSFLTLMEALIGLSGLNIVGCDVVELSPMLDASGASTAAACKIVRELLLALSAKHIKNS